MNINEFKKAFNCTDLDNDEAAEKMEIHFGDTDPMLPSSYVFAVSSTDEPCLILSPKHFFQENDIIPDDLDPPVYDLLPEIELELVSDSTYIWDTEMYSVEEVIAAAEEVEMENITAKLESMMS